MTLDAAETPFAENLLLVPERVLTNPGTFALVDVEAPESHADLYADVLAISVFVDIGDVDVVFPSSCKKLSCSPCLRRADTQTPTR